MPHHHHTHHANFTSVWSMVTWIRRSSPNASMPVQPVLCNLLSVSSVLSCHLALWLSTPTSTPPLSSGMPFPAFILTLHSTCSNHLSLLLTTSETLDIQTISQLFTRLPVFQSDTTHMSHHHLFCPVWTLLILYLRLPCLATVLLFTLRTHSP
jgi:hypothetical protein